MHGKLFKHSTGNLFGDKFVYNFACFRNIYSPKQTQCNTFFNYIVYDLIGITNLNNDKLKTKPFEYRFICNSSIILLDETRANFSADLLPKQIGSDV